MNLVSCSKRITTGATIVAVVSCYGTLALIALLSLAGISIAAGERTWARAAVVLFAALATLGIALSSVRNRRFAPLLASGIGLLLTSWATYGYRNRLVEALGFALLISGTILDRRSCAIDAARRSSDC